ncbi:protein FAM228B-like isoform X1 [Eublepharis macularius]|uniref:Protein FAM228B-like isoform X1 n=1 Tax=Eublepharis macularius TaxID=481883 RepID=A0AA97KQC7_EUBMA|nr:protein FAM228B-like isoform X1 [Eublepharis macularius]
MEVAREGLATPGSGSLSSTLAAPVPPRPPLPGLPERVVSSSSLNSESSEEDWLIKVCCPGARHRYSRNVHSIKPFKTGFPQKLNKEDALAEYTPECTSFQSYPRVPRKESSELEWLIRLRCPRAQMEQQEPGPKQPRPEVSSSLSTTQSKTGRSSLSARANTSESWLTQKHLSALQAVVSRRHDVVGSAPSLLERENCFVREVDRYLKHNEFLALRRKEMQYKKWFENVSSPLLQKIQDKVDKQSSEEIEERKRKQLSLYLNYCNKKQSAYLESYSPSVYDPFFLKTCTDILQVSVPPLRDPLLKEVQGRYVEEGIIQQCDTGRIYSYKEMNELLKARLPLFPLSRQIMNPADWVKIPLGYVESEIRQKSRQKMSTTRNKTTMDFTCWGDPSWLLPNRRFSSAQKPDLASRSSLLAKQTLSGSSSSTAIKSAS